MVVMPLFWDQYDNAQRMHELGFGIRLDTYRFTDDEMVGALDTLLADTDLRTRMATTAARIREHDGVRRAADLIEALGAGDEGLRGGRSNA
jgi:UDP:flavonoid glycosyltransferase YjiC (YdhE family)